MYNVYLIKDGVEELLFSSNSIKSNSKIVKGVIAEEKNAIASFSFTLYPNNPFYEDLKEYASRISVFNTQTNKYVFEGRVLICNPSMDESGLYYKDIVCESNLGYLNDSIQMYRSEKIYGSAKQFLDELLLNHNNQVEAHKKIYAGDITHITGNFSKAITYENTWTLIKWMISEFGGEIALKKVDGVYKLNYKSTVGSLKTTTIEVGKNIKSSKKQVDSSLIVTRIIPLGAKLKLDGNETPERLTISSVNSGVAYIQDDETYDQYGEIYKTVEFENITTAQELKNAAIQWIQENNYASINVSITALDLSLIGLETDEFALLDKYQVTNKLVGIDNVLTIVKRSINILEPHTSTFELGVFSKKFSDLYKKQNQSAASAQNRIGELDMNIKNNMVYISAHYATITNLEATNARITNLSAIYARITDLDAINASITNLSTIYAKITDLNAINASITNLSTIYAKITDLNAINASIVNLNVVYAKITDLNATNASITNLSTIYAKITDLNAVNATITSLDTKYAKVDLANITAGSIKTAMISTGAIGTAQIADGSITDAKIVALTATKITSGTLDAGVINVINLNCANLTVGTINGTQIANGAIDSTKLATAINTAISNAQTTANGKNTVYYSATAPTGGTYKLNDTWFETDNSNRMYYWNGTAWTATVFGTNALATACITNALIADATIQNAKIANIDAAKITTGYISADRIAANAITTAKIAANAITTALIAAGAITATQIAVDAVTADKIVSSAITTAKIAAGAVTANEIAANAITAAKIAAGVILATHLGAGSVTSAAIAAGAVTAEKITVGSGGVAPGNLASGKATSGTTVSTSATDGAKVVGSAYVTFGAGSSTNNAAESGYLQIDLGGVYRLAESRLYFYSADARTYFYKVKYSSDGTNWYYAVGNETLTGWAISVTPRAVATGSSNPTIDSFAVPISARYIRVYSNGNSVNTGNHIYEWEVFSTAQTIIDGSSITTGEIRSINYVSGATGMKLNLLDGSWDSKYFKVNNLGEVTATKGYIGGLKIDDNGLLFEDGTGNNYLYPNLLRFYTKTTRLNGTIIDVDFKLFGRSTTNNGQYANTGIIMSCSDDIVFETDAGLVVTKYGGASVSSTEISDLKITIGNGTGNLTCGSVQINGTLDCGWTTIRERLNVIGPVATTGNMTIGGEFSAIGNASIGGNIIARGGVNVSANAPNYTMGIYDYGGHLRIKTNVGSVCLMSNSGIVCGNFNDTWHAPITASAFTVVSSKRYKDHIEYMSESDGDKILDLQVVKFDYKGAYGAKGQYGLYAEDTFKIIPTCVTVIENVIEGIDYSKLVPFMIKKIQMQENEIKYMKTMITHLQGMAMSKGV